MSIHDDVIEILNRTRDGRELTPADLALTERCVNSPTEANEVSLAVLLAAVTDGSYFTTGQWFRGIPNLNMGHLGHMYWKGAEVEHYSFEDKDAELAAAKKLADRCMKLEAAGFPVNTRTAIHAECYDAPANTPWKLALLKFYGFFKQGDRVIAVFHSTVPGRGVFSIQSIDGSPQVDQHDEAYLAFRSLQGSGLKPVNPPQTYEQALALLEAIGVTPEDIDQEIRRVPSTELANA